ncbi:helix-turn-helix domain-containing protein [Rothia sp. P13129]|uniref:helix-turn-helix domain-containing protein n=1 Tax=Rothia sp. P13129 TaxID=3402664 RepID=UPI003AD7CE9A
MANFSNHLANKSDEAPELVVNPETAKKLRLRRGYTMEWASNQIGRQKGWVSKIENAKLKLTGEDLENYANLLDVPVSLMTKTLPEVSAEGLMFRKYRTPKKVVSRLESEAELRVHIFNSLLDIAKQPRKPTFPQYNVENTPRGPIGAAQLIRERWGVGNEPINDLAGLLEREGIIITDMPINVEKVAGATFWELEDSAPMIMLSNKILTVTQRFTLAHEFAHLVLDKTSPLLENAKDIEQRADIFAGELLAPYELVCDDFLKIRTDKVDDLLRLATYWGLHPKSFVIRAAKVGDISKDRATAWYKKLNGTARDIIELNQCLYPVKPTAIPRILGRLSEFNWTPGLLMKQLNLRISDFKSIIGEKHWNFDDRPMRGVFKVVQ